jgi:hypothetical protein
MPTHVIANKPDTIATAAEIHCTVGRVFAKKLKAAEPMLAAAGVTAPLMVSITVPPDRSRRLRAGIRSIGGPR